MRILRVCFIVFTLLFLVVINLLCQVPFLVNTLLFALFILIVFAIDIHQLRKH